MKNKHLFLAAAAVLALGACRSEGSQTARVDGIAFDSIVTDTTARLVEGSGDAPTCHVRLSIQYAKGDQRARALNDSLLHGGLLSPDYLALGSEHLDVRHAVDSFAARYVADYKAFCAPLYREDPQNAGSYRNEYVVDTHTENGRDDVVNYFANVYQYGGGAHGIRQTLVWNIDMQSGRVLRLADVLKDGADEELCRLIVKQMGKQLGASSLEELRQKGVFVGLDAYPTDNFVVGRDGLTFIYVEDEIAPHALGEIRVSLPYGDLKEMLKQ